MEGSVSETQQDAVAVLRDIQWIYDSECGNSYCPDCESRQDMGHSKTCRIAVVLAATPTDKDAEIARLRAQVEHLTSILAEGKADNWACVWRSNRRSGPTEWVRKVEAALATTPQPARMEGEQHE